jgi:hypothetical protein
MSTCRFCSSDDEVTELASGELVCEDCAAALAVSLHRSAEEFAYLAQRLGQLGEQLRPQVIDTAERTLEEWREIAETLETCGASLEVSTSLTIADRQSRLPTSDEVMPECLQDVVDYSGYGIQFWATDADPTPLLEWALDHPNGSVADLIAALKVKRPPSTT